MSAITNSKFYFVIIIDDAHFLKDKEFIGFLRNEYQVNNKILFIFGVDKDYDSIITSYDNAFYGQFNILQLSGLGLNQSIDFINSFFSFISSKKLDQDKIELVAEIANGNVALLRMTAIIAAATQEGGQDTFYKNVSDMLNMVIAPNISPQAMAILQVLSTEEDMTASTIAKKLYISTATSTIQLKRMMDKGHVIKENGKYKAMNFIKVMFNQTL